jgi:hypothetical protein
MEKIQIKQVVIWGHKLHTHTHSYIHNAFFRTFQHLGYKTTWYDDDDDVKDVDFSSSLFITEHSVNKKIPCRQDCLYLSHYVDEGDYPGVPKEHIVVLKVSPRDFYETGENKDKGKNYIYKPLSYGTKHEYQSLIDGYQCLYMYWATDLLPEEINANIKALPFMKSIENTLFLIGSMTDVWFQFKGVCASMGLKMIHYGPFSHPTHSTVKTLEENIQLIQQSVVAPALQDRYQLHTKYIPCRIFKNISYGKMGMTNNPIVYELFDRQILYHRDIGELLKKGLRFEKDPQKNKHITRLMEYVRDNHTYLNRIHTISQFISEYTGFIL